MGQRGGAKRIPSEKGLASKKKDAEEQTDDATTKMTKALDSMRFSSKASLYSAAVGGCKILVDGMDGGLDLEKVTDFVTVLNRIIIGFGLRREAKIYVDSRAKDGVGAATAQTIYNLGRIDAQIWAQSFAVVNLGAMAIANSWKQQTISWMPSIVMEQPAAFVLTIALVGAPILFAVANRAAARAESAGLPAETESSAGATVSYATARSMGLFSVNMMLLCAGANALLGLVQLVTAITQTGWIALAFGLLDVIGTISIGGLLALLNESTRRAVVTATEGTAKTEKEYVGLYEAQIGFYQKIGSVFKFESFFKALGIAKLLYETVKGTSS